MEFWQALRTTWGGSVAFIIACPLLALVPVFFELVQHAVEVHIGMYDGIAAAKAVGNGPLRMAFGFVKSVALLVPVYWVTRFLAYRNAQFAGRLDRPALRLFGAYLGFQIVLVAIQLLVLPQTGWISLASLLVSQVIACLVVAWGVAAALGNPVVGPRLSAQIMRKQLPWTFVFLIVAILPLMIPHYALFSVALMMSKTLLWPTLIVDSLLVGWLSAVIVASWFVAATRAGKKQDVVLVPGLNSAIPELQTTSA